MINRLKYFLKVQLEINSVVIYTCLLLYVVTAFPKFVTGDIFDVSNEMLLKLGANFYPLVKDGEYFRFVTSIFLHGGLTHFLLNMYSLYSLGGFIETYFGRGKYFLVLILSGLLGSVFSYIFNSSFSVGISGSIFGFLGLVLSQKLKKRFGYDLPVDTRSIMTIVVINLFIGFTIPRVDNAAHIGGLLGGLLLGLLIEPENSRSNYTLIDKALILVSLIVLIYSILGVILNLFI